MESNHKKEPTNPLGVDPKREKSGSTTLEKYHFQYHWAFLRIINEYEDNNDYAVFVEEHEDVLVAYGLDLTEPTFSLDQVKETSSKHSITTLTTKKNVNSPLQKLALSCCKKSFSKAINNVNYVSSGGFTFEVHKKGFNHEVISSSLLEKNEIEALRNNISEITKDNSFIDMISFIVPDLPSKGFETYIEGKISELISKESTNINYNSNSVYSIIIKDLLRKGTNSFDYEKWKDSLKKKSITRTQFKDILNKNTNRNLDQSLIISLNEILNNDYDSKKLKPLKKIEIRLEFEKYYIENISSTEKEFLKISNEIRSLISKNIVEYEKIKDFEQFAYNNLDLKSKEYFRSDEHFTGAFIYELLTG